MVIHDVNSRESIETAFDDALDTDVIRFIGAGSLSFSGFTQNLANGKSISVVLGSGVTDVTLNMGAFEVLILTTGTAANVTWEGPITITNSDVTADICDVDAADGDLTVTMTEIDFRGVWVFPAAADAGRGIEADAHGVYDCVLTMINCEARGTANDGFACKDSGTGTVTMNLIDCLGEDNAVEGASPRGTTIMNVQGGTYQNNAQNQIGMGNGGLTINIVGVTIIHHAAATGAALAFGDGNIGWVSGTTVTCASGVSTDGTIISVAGDSGGGGASIVFADCTLTNTGQDKRIIRMSGPDGSELTIWDSTINFGNLQMSGAAVVAVEVSGTLNVYRCVLDASTWVDGVAINRYLFRCIVGGTLNIEGCTGIGMGTSVSSHYFVDYDTGSAGSFIHNTLYTANNTNRGVWIEVAGIVVRGNVIVGAWNMGFRFVAGAIATYDLATSGYNNVFGAATRWEGYTDPVNGKSGDLITDPELIAVPGNLRLGAASPAAFLDPTAAYQIDSFGLTLSASGSGTVAQVPTNDRTTNSKEPVPAGELGIDLGAYNNISSPVALMATPSSNWEFDGWSGGLSTTSNPATVIMSQARTVTANFSRVFAVSTAPNQPEGQSILTRGTRVFSAALSTSATRTEWDFRNTQALDTPLLFTTTSSGSSLGNVLDGDLQSIIIWFDPFSAFQVRVRQLINGSYTAWSKWVDVPARGLISSFENYALLNAEAAG